MNTMTPVNHKQFASDLQSLTTTIAHSPARMEADTITSLLDGFVFPLYDGLTEAEKESKAAQYDELCTLLHSLEEYRQKYPKEVYVNTALGFVQNK
jgi:hypothetical protein